MTENFNENSRKLSEVLTDLLSIDCDENICSSAVFEPAIHTEDHSQDDNFLDAYQITFIPANTKHPLCHITKCSDKGFFLLGKAVVDTVENEDGDEELQVSVVELSRQKSERVLVGTPLSQDVAFINGSSPLHQGSKSSATNRLTSRSQNCIDEWRLDNFLGIHPVQIDKARYLISLFDHSLTSNMSNVQVPFWVVVDENNTGTVTHMASLPVGVQPDRIVNHVVITCNGPYPKTEALPNINTIQRLHNQKCLGTVVENSSYGYALYDLLGVSHAVEEEDQKSCACVEFAWKDIHSLVQPPPLTSDCVLHIKCLPGSMQLTDFSLTSEVNKLMCFHAMILDSDQQWPDPASQEMQEVQLRIMKVLENIDSEAFSQVIHDNDDQSRVSTSSSPAEHLSNQEFAPRKDLDFTENLWLILKDALHFDDLAACLKIAMNALLSGACQIVIHPSNKTHLAMFIRQLLQCETNEQRHQLKLKVEKMFDYEVALKCLVGIGCEKLLRDHTNYFLCEELVTQDQLKYFMDGNIPLSQKVERVAKLQNVLDLVITTKCILNTGHANLQLLTQSALIYYESHSHHDHPVFSLPLPAYSSTSISAVKSIISNEQPSVWCLALKSKTKKDTATTIVQLSTESPINTMTNYLNNETKDDLTMSLTSKAPYYLSFARQTTVPLITSQ